MTAGLLLLLGAGGLLLGAMAGLRSARAWLALTLVGTMAGLGASLTVLYGTSDWEWKSGLSFGGELVYLRVDGLSAFFLAILSVVGGFGAVYSRSYWAESQFPRSAPRGRVWWNVLVLCMGMVLTISNGLHFLISWELFAVSAFFLITLDSQRPEVRQAGWLYLAASHAGTVCLFAFFGLLAVHTGSWELGPWREQKELAPLFWLALAGFGMKAGLFPLHLWLPSAHANAPSHVSAIMSGVAIKMGIYGIMRFSGWLPVPSAAGTVVLGLGTVSALLGIALALAQNEYKRLLAYCSVENIGVILTGVGAALLSAAHGGDEAWGRLAMAGALLHVWNHGAFKALLFFAAGAVLHAAGTREMSRLGGLWRTMPWTAGLFLLGAMAVSGLPPLNGFVSEWLIYLGLFASNSRPFTFAWAVGPAAILLAGAGALTLASFLKAGAMIFLGAARSQMALHTHECSLGMRGPMIALAGICLCLGLAPALVWPALSRAAQSWRPTWAVLEAQPMLVAIGPVHLGLAFFIILAVAGLWLRSRANSLQRGPTWDCGYAVPTPRMQYSSASFAGIAVGWLGWALLPELRLKRPRGLFPRQAFRLERVPDPVLEKAVTPAGVVILRISTAVRRLQHGRLQFYILYLLVGLLAVSIVTLLGIQL